MINALAAQTPVTASTPGQPQNAELHNKAKDFEAMFLSEMFSHMFEGVKTDPMFGGGRGEEIFRSMLVQEYGKAMAKGHGIGLADHVQKMMIQMQQKG